VRRRRPLHGSRLKGLGPFSSSDAASRPFRLYVPARATNRVLGGPQWVINRSTCHEQFLSASPESGLPVRLTRSPESARSCGARGAGEDATVVVGIPDVAPFGSSGCQLQEDFYPGRSGTSRLFWRHEAAHRALSPIRAVAAPNPIVISACMSGVGLHVESIGIHARVLRWTEPQHQPRDARYREFSQEFGWCDYQKRDEPMDYCFSLGRPFLGAASPSPSRVCTTSPGTPPAPRRSYRHAAAGAVGRCLDGR
jgi:hypothetical protein